MALCVHPILGDTMRVWLGFLGGGYCFPTHICTTKSYSSYEVQHKCHLLQEASQTAPAKDITGAALKQSNISAKF